MKDSYDILLTKVFLTVASITGVSTNILQDADLILGIVLKVISIMSFVIVIALNLPKLIKMIKLGFKK